MFFFIIWKKIFKNTKNIIAPNSKPPILCNLNYDITKK